MLAHAHYPADPRVSRAAKAAYEAGYSVDVISLKGPHELPREIVDGVMVHRLSVFHRRGLPLLRTLFEYLSLTALAFARIIRLSRGRRIQIVHVHSPPDFLIAAAVPCKLCGSRVILDIHDLSPPMYQARFRARHSRALAWLLSSTLKTIQRLACGIADEVVTVHEPYRRELVDSGVPFQKITVVMNSMDEFLSESVLTSRRKKESDGNQFTVAYHGTITEWYGVGLIVEAIARAQESLPGIQALVLGEGDALERAKQLARDLGVSNRVSFSGKWLPLEETLRQIANADCGVIPNRPSNLNRFALSSKLFEYVRLGVPVVVSRLETLASHFDDSEVTFFNPGDVTSLTSAIRWVAEHPGQARQKAMQARERYSSSYSWPENRDRYVRLLDRLSREAMRTERPR